VAGRGSNADLVSKQPKREPAAHLPQVIADIILRKSRQPGGSSLGGGRDFLRWLEGKKTLRIGTHHVQISRELGENRKQCFERIKALEFQARRAIGMPTVTLEFSAVEKRLSLRWRMSASVFGG